MSENKGAKRAGEINKENGKATKPQTLWRVPISHLTAMASQIEKAQDLKASFEMFDNWEDRYRFLIDMGRALPPFPPNQKYEKNLVHGCQSQVWMIPVTGENGTLDFLADSDSTLVKGLIAILREIYAGQKAADILSFDINGFLAELGLDQHLSMGRRNGLAGMVTKLKTLAAHTEAANQ